MLTEVSIGKYLIVPFMSSILESIFCAKATSMGVGGLPQFLGLLALKVNLKGVWDLEPPELVGLGLGAPLELLPLGTTVGTVLLGSNI